MSSSSSASSSQVIDSMNSKWKTRKSFVSNATEEYDITDDDETLRESTVITQQQQTNTKIVVATDVEINDYSSPNTQILQGKLKVNSTIEKQSLHKVTSHAQLVNRFRYTTNGDFRSRFSDVRYQETKSILDSDIARNSPFWGFYTPFWLAIAIMMANICTEAIREKGLLHSIGTSRIIQIFFQDVIWIGLCDFIMYLSLYGSFFIQWLCKKEYMLWETTGFVLQCAYEVGFFFGVMWWLELSNYQWIGKVFLVLHSLVLLMKMHSFAFYNGYLWRIKHELAFSESYLKKHDKVDDKTTAILQKSIDFCKFEIDNTSKHNPQIQFPNNLTLSNFFWYTMFPTVVYEVEYPRTTKIDFGYLAEKIVGVFGIIAVMIVVAQERAYPLAMRAIHMKSLPFQEKLREYPFLLLEMLPPFFLLYILVFLLIWDQILNAIAELTKFADRDFYGPWWNCITFDEFARLWNVPVHKFLLRHVYHSSISAFQISKTSATLVTFLLSSVFHEVVMYVLFGRLRCYLFLIQMYQIPLIAISRTKFMRGRSVLGNIIFWIGVASGAAIVSSLYLVF
ncbi:sterol acyltransferase [Saccharomycopsis crataegensis]|uniref:O-acyltransferase n=1 Tax=Saccharomycopsis crataegensis TaxID=43959 RepID=A0AAV5QNR7_9ASCO|nr:sterol acyltransferase [Saccharomycopsis crataegensis]